MLIFWVDMATHLVHPALAKLDSRRQRPKIVCSVAEKVWGKPVAEQEDGYTGNAGASRDLQYVPLRCP